jgi:hypothetical protein
MKKLDDLEYIFQYLDKMYDRYLTTTKKCKTERNEIESLVRKFANNIDDGIYLELSQGLASGLFEHGFFESDMKRSLQILKQKLGLS